MPTKKVVAEIAEAFAQDDPAAWVTHQWTTLNNQRQEKLTEWEELRNYIFATDTTTTSNSSLPWKNSTTLPKLCQIRDNLHSNYVSALFPHDDWLQWKGYSQEDSMKVKADSIKAYMLNKTREGRIRTELSRLLYDYIDYGNAFATVSFESSYKELESGERVPDYVGPRLHRISPLDVVFNSTATNFRDTFKIVRSLKTIGELKRLVEIDPDQAFWQEALDRRQGDLKKMAGYSMDDFNTAVGYQMDGFGSYYEYLQSDYVEILTFYGDFHDQTTGELMTNQQITITDRANFIHQCTIPSWLGHAPIYHVGWRFRPDNLWSMGPLDNLVGMQYRIDHLENLKADAMDLVVHPPLKIIGEVEEFNWGPNARIHIDENGDVQELGQNLNGIITAATEIQSLEDRMELYSGAPREAMGVRTPGEKTALEVQTLATAAGRIFQEKIVNFEVELLEPALNAMLETARRNIDYTDMIRVMDSATGIEQIRAVTKADITANGVLRPVGARHFSKQSQDLQNLIGVMSSPVGQMIAPHASTVGMAKFVEDAINMKGWNIFKKNAGVEDQAETQSYMNQAAEDLEVEQRSPAEGAM